MNKRKILMGVIIIGCVLFGLTYLFINYREGLRGARKKAEVASIETKQEKTQQSKPPEVTKESAKITPEVNTEIQALINKLTDEDLKIAQEAADKLVRMGEKVIPDLTSALKEASVGLKGQIVFILGRIGSKKATPELMEALRKDENPYIRKNAAEALGKIKDEMSLSGLGLSLFDQDTVVRQNSAWALGQLRNASGAGFLLQSLNEERELGVRFAVVESLKTIKDRSATEALLKELKKENDISFKKEVVLALGEIADPKALGGLTEYLGVLKGYKPAVEVKWYYEESIKKVEEAIEKCKS